MYIDAYTYYKLVYIDSGSGLWFEWLTYWIKVHIWHKIVFVKLLFIEYSTFSS